MGSIFSKTFESTPIPLTYEGDCTQFTVALYLAIRKPRCYERNYLRELLNTYSAYPEADQFPGVEEALRSKLKDCGRGVWRSHKIATDHSLEAGSLTSLSHHGVLSTYHKKRLHLSDMVSGEAISIDVETDTQAAFYDSNIILLTYGMKLRECFVEQMFKHKNVGVLTDLGGISVTPWTDVSLVNTTRFLMLRSLDNCAYEYDVDSGFTSKLETGKSVWSFISMSGIDVGVKGVFSEIGGEYGIYIISKQNMVTKVHDSDVLGTLCAFVPSTSDPGNVSKFAAVNSGWNFRGRNDNKTVVRPVLGPYTQLIRLYRDVFLVQKTKTKEWIVVRITVM